MPDRTGRTVAIVVCAAVVAILGWSFAFGSRLSLAPLSYAGDTLTVTHLRSPRWTRTLPAGPAVQAFGTALTTETAPPPMGGTNLGGCASPQGTYRLTFRRGKTTVLTAQMFGSYDPFQPAQICSGVTADGQTEFMVSAFAARFARLLGIPEATVFGPRDFAPQAAAAGAAPARASFWNGRTGLIGSQTVVPRDGQTPAGTWTVISLTQDGGRQFTPSLVLFDQRLLAMGTPNASDAWVATGNCDVGACSVAVYRTSDGGLSWTAAPVPAASGRAPQPVPDYLSGEIAWSVGGLQRGRILPGVSRSRDGGRTWRPVGDICPAAAPTPSLATFTSPAEGYLLCTGAPVGGTRRAVLLRTSDGWRRWSAATLAPAAGVPAGLAMLADGRGWLWGAAGLFATTDGGRTWTRRAARPILGASLTSAAGWVLESFASGATTVLLRTADLGRTWRTAAAWPAAAGG